MADVLRAPLVLEYPFTRTTGPVVGAFLTGLREGVLLGARRADGTVLCPPLEYDPLTSDPLHELVEVGQTGTVATWTWNGPPRPQQPFDVPFAWAMIVLDGADTPILHGVIVDGPDAMRTGMRVQAVWNDERTGHIADLHFAAGDAGISTGAGISRDAGISEGAGISEDAGVPADAGIAGNSGETS